MKHLVPYRETMVERGRRARTRAAAVRPPKLERRVSVRWLVALVAVSLELGAFVAWIRRRPQGPEELPTAV